MPQPSGRARATELLNLLENLAVQSFCYVMKMKPSVVDLMQHRRKNASAGCSRLRVQLALDLAVCFRVRNGMQLDHSSGKFGATTDMPFRQRCIKQPSVLSSMPRRGF